MAPRQATKAQNLIEELNRLRGQDKPDSFSIRRIEREGKKLFATDRAAAYQVLGMTATLLEDPDGMRRNFKYALELSRDAPEIMKNYSTSLLTLGFLIEARQFLEQFYDTHHGDSIFLDYLILSSYKSGRFEKAASLLGDLKKIQPDVTHVLDRKITTCHDFLKFNNVLADEIEMLVMKFERFLHDRKIFLRDNSFYVIADEESQNLVGKFELRSTTVKIVNLNFELADFLARLDLPEKITSRIQFLLVSQDATSHDDNTK